MSLPFVTLLRLWLISSILTRSAYVSALLPEGPYTCIFCNYSPITPVFNSCPAEVVITHSGGMLRECCKGNDESLWGRGKYDPPPLKKPSTDSHQNWHTWLLRWYLPPCKILYRSDKGCRFCAVLTVVPLKSWQIQKVTNFNVKLFCVAYEQVAEPRILVNFFADGKIRQQEARRH